MNNKLFKRTVSAAAAAAVIFGNVNTAFAQSAENTVRYEEGEPVSVIVMLKEEPVLACDEAAEMGTTYLETPEGQAKIQKLLDSQEEAEEYIRAIYPDAEAKYSYTALLNGFSCDIPFDLIDDVESLPMVESVCISKNHLSPRMFTAPERGGVQAFVDNTGYTGKGEVVAVIDTELDITHDMFKPISDSKAKLKKQDIQKVKDSVGFHTDFEVDVDKAYVSSKLPFVLDYCDSDDHYSLADEKAYHGTHVSGIAAGNLITDVESGNQISGIAPDAQIVFMKVGDSEGIISDEAAVAAIEDAVKLNVDAINLSFGGDSEFQSYYYTTVLDNAEKSGVIVCAAAGNTSYFEDFPENPDYGTVDSPGDYKSSFCVAAATNAYSVMGIMTLKDSDEPLQYIDGYHIKLADEFGASSVEYAFCASGSAEDINKVDVSGKLALVDGESTTATFEEIGNNAAAAGAVGVIIINEYCFVTNAAAEGFAVPYVTVNKETGQKLLDAENKTVFVDKYGKRVKEDTEICDFSSRGVSQDLDLKPDISGVGQNVYSAAYGNKLVELSGTSMATPYIAGCTLLVDQYLSENKPDIKGSDKAKLVKNIMMNTAKPLTIDSLYVSPRAQGSGLVDLSAVTKANVIMTDDSGYAKVCLHDGLTDTFSFNVKVKNYSNKAVSFSDASLDLTTDSVTEKENGLKYIDGVRKLNASVTGLDKLKTLKAGEEKTVKLTVKLDSTQSAEIKKEFINGFFVDGFVTLSGSSDTADISIPIMGFYGDWSAVPIFDKTWTESGAQTGFSYFKTYLGAEYNIPLDVSFSKLAQLYSKYGMEEESEDIIQFNDKINTREDKFRYELSSHYNSSFYNAGSDEFKGVFNDNICISPNYDGWGDELHYDGLLLRAAKAEGIKVYDVKGNMVADTFSDEYDTDGAIDLYENSFDGLDDGKYKAVMTAYINYDGAENKKQTYSREFEIDTVPPLISDIKTEEKDGRKILSFKATDKHLDGIYVLGQGKGGEYGKYDPSDETQGYNIDCIRTMLDDFSDHCHDEEEDTDATKASSTLFNKFVDSSGSDESKVIDADFLDIIHAEPDKNGSYAFRYDITDLKEYSICVMDTAFNMSDYGVDIPYVGMIDNIGEIKAGTVLKLKKPVVKSDVPIKSEGWKLVNDGGFMEEFDPSKPVDESCHMWYLCYYVDTGKYTTYSNQVLIKIKGKDTQKFNLQIKDSNGYSYGYSIDGNSIDLSDLPEDDYLITVKKLGYITRTYIMHIDSTTCDFTFALAKLGDVDVSGSIDIEDAVSVIAEINGITPLDDYGLTVADTDGSGSVDIEDAVLIIGHINGLKPIEE